MLNKSPLSQYNQTAVHAVAEDASPHRLIQMLMQGALDKMANAKGAMLRSDIPAKGEQISWAISILSGLRGSLNQDAGEIAQNLYNLYEYMERRLVEANIQNDPDYIDEVMGLLKEIKGAWDAIGDGVDNMGSPKIVGG